ncbi:hypothetical protein, partial [Streptomyces sp. NPDC004042]|uniref:hypothetical protein n=1 Tax=Streptomyces sp. NPDC004042 TaxID=3154451 RepID=UPI0033AE3662
GTYVVLALLVVLLRARIISLASRTPRIRGHLTQMGIPSADRTDKRSTVPVNIAGKPSRHLSEDSFGEHAQDMSECAADLRKRLLKIT